MSTSPNRASHRVALLGIAAILFQALLFGWHHHPVVLASQGAQPVAHAATGTPPSPAADDDCDICQTLHNLSGSPVAFATLAPPLATAPPLDPLEHPLAGWDFPLAFQARAPPRS